MNIDEWRNGINLCIDNVKQLYEDGILLMKNKAFSHACFSFITSFEEAAVAYFIMENFDKPQPDQLKELLNHRKKLSLSSFKSVPIMARNFTILREYYNIVEKQLLSKLDSLNNEFFKEDSLNLGESLSEQNSLMYLRNRSIYVRMNREKTKFLTPKMINEETVKILYNILSIFILQLIVDRDLLFKFGSNSKKLIKCELEFTKAINKVVEISEILNEGSVEKLNKSQAIELEDSDFFIKIIMNRDKIQLHNQNYLSNLISRILKPLAHKFTHLLKHQEFRTQYDFAIERFKVYNSKLAEIIIAFYEILKNISNNTLNIQDFPLFLKFFNLPSDHS